MKKILITGGNGYLGNFLNINLKKKYIIDTLGKSNNNDFRINLLDANKVKSFFKKYKYDCILHCAAYVPGKQNLLKKKHYLHNHIMTKNVVNYSSSKIIFFSTYRVYKDNARVGFPYKINCTKITNYASSKIFSENLIVKKKKNYLILRLPTIFGEGVKNGLLYNVIKNNYINDKINENWYVLYADRILRPLEKFLEKKLNAGIYNIAYQGDQSFDLIQNFIFKILNKKTRLSPKKKFFLKSNSLNYSLNNLKKDLIKYIKYVINC